MNSLLINLLHCKQKTENYTMHALQVIHQSQRDHVNDSLISDIPTFNGKPEPYFNWILRLEKIATVTEGSPKELALGKAQGEVINCLKTQVGMM